MNILVLNCGSSSLKYQLFDMRNESVLAKGLVERIGMDEAILTHRSIGRDQLRTVQPIFEHGAALNVVIQALLDPDYGVIAEITDIHAAGHRVVHGGEFFTQSTLVTEDVKKAISDCIELAPLHNPPNLKGITAAEKLMPNIPQVVVFDTAFHASIPSFAYLYALPYQFYQRYKVRRYGFHGTSHKFVARRAAELMGQDLNSLKLISCHLGNGASITAINRGQSVDTSMGFTPLEGLMMGTRCGDIDPAIIPYVMAKDDLSIREIDSMLNRHSGLLGVSGLSSDMRDITEAAAEGNSLAHQAFDMYVHRIRKYIGAYAVEMNGLDTIVFTAGIGENSPMVREEVCQFLTILGVEFDSELNTSQEAEREITRQSSRVKVWVIPTNEELMIARETRECCTAR